MTAEREETPPHHELRDQIRDEILARLERVERENRRLRRGLAAAAALLLPLVLVQCRGGGGGEVIASRFVVQDAEGRTRAVLGFEKTEIEKKEENGKKEESGKEENEKEEGAEEGQVRLRLFDEAGGRRASLALTAEGYPGLALFHGTDRAAAILEVGAKGPSFTMLDSKANVLFRRP